MFKLLRELRSLVSSIAIIVCVCMSLLNQASQKTALVAAATTTTITTATLGGNGTDYLALLSIKAQITNDPMLVTSSWNDSLHFCLWEGEIPHEMGSLFRLQVLNLTHNLLEGQIPANLSSCNNLRRLSLGYNKFIGNLPIELGSLNQLVHLYMNSNNLSGAIPPSFGNLSSLKLFSISENMLEGSIPNSLGSLKSLRYLSFISNKISGMIPPSIYNISSLTALEARVNLLEGSLPQNLGLTLPNIKRLNLGKNHLSGSIPLSIANASKLEHLILSANKLYPRVAVNFGNLKNLLWLSLFEDGLGTGDANDLNFILTLVNCSKLRILSLDANNFGGVLPNSLVNLSTQHHISGNIPVDFGNLVSLNAVDMSYNRLTGTIPTSIGKLHKIQELGFGKNKLSGEIPSSIGNWTLANQLWLEENDFQGNIPSSLGNCIDLILLHLYGNNLSGSIPREVIGISSLSKSLDLSRNSLTGPIPPEVGSLKTLVELNLSYNKLSGKIPSSLGSCNTLEYLFLDNNSLGGAIPQSLSSLKAIEELGLSHNNLSGEIPIFFEKFPFLRNLNLSFNNLEGEVPVKGVFQNASAISISRNNKLCGGIPVLQLPTCAPKKPRKLIIPIVFGVLGIILASSILILCCLRKMRKQSLVASSLMDSSGNISYRDLLKATNGFSSDNLIGTGSFGSVYKGILHPNEKTIAVKVLDQQNVGASKSFLAECKTLRNIKHRNLIKIISVCASVDFQGNDFKALIYEFMENGSLESWLHPVSQTGTTHKQPKSLNLLQRLGIAIDVASALDYLHNHCHVPIIHCDIKPSNILLDSDMTAHVGDFGLARLLQNRNNEVSHSQNSSVGIKGTIGYAAPGNLQ
ncbi:probable LRR receptor-like serine/threonine-protein kinase At3g47570 [Camellia sinensis]|uniref:probable LRR receptor-like serine/threonine-protein kinase At3g47570 n=1 Tax=Camellia sinensis TaxID=4442 RepID=UPI001035F5C7|nr:probable LRR receptor-like serine/threonine-protein kinase At3g47570 [Camellia sinensis]